VPEFQYVVGGNLAARQNFFDLFPVRHGGITPRENRRANVAEFSCVLPKWRSRQPGAIGRKYVSGAELTDCEP
jgi:hypothetical protein